MQLDQTMQQAESIVRFAEEVDRRLAECGIGGTGELLVIYRQLREALGQVSFTDLEWAAQEIGRLQKRLRDLGIELDHLSALKATFAVQH